MTVEQLIRELQKHPPQSKVVGEGFIMGDELLVRVAYDPNEKKVHLVGERA